MRINPVNIAISNNYYNPVRWSNGCVRPQTTSTNSQESLNSVSISRQANEQLFTPELTMKYDTAKAPSEGQRSLAIANFAASNMELWKKIKKTFGIELVNTTEASFQREEMEIIFKTLGDVPKQHLAGILSIVKANGFGLELELMQVKTNGKTVLGAYDKKQKRVYIFESCPLGDLRSTLLHEIGHAVHSFCVTSKTILLTAKKAGWALKEFRSSYLANNTLYPIVLQACIADDSAWNDAYSRFSESELKMKRTIDGRYVLEAPASHKDQEAYINPLETFACLYERQYG